MAKLHSGPLSAPFRSKVDLEVRLVLGEIEEVFARKRHFLSSKHNEISLRSSIVSGPHELSATPLKVRVARKWG